MRKRERRTGTGISTPERSVSSAFAAVGFAILLIAAPLFTSWAQDASQTDAFAQKFQERLQLSDAQMEQLRPVIAADMEQRKEIIQKYRGQGQGAYGPMRGELDSLNASTEGKMSRILSDAQMVEYKKWKQEQADLMRERARTRMQQRQGSTAEGGD